MSRYGGDYGGRGPPAERWTPERFQRERGGRQSTVMERDTHYEERDNYSNAGSRRRETSADGYRDHRPARGGGRDRIEDDHFFEKEERYGPPARRSGGGRRYEEDEEIDSFVDYKSGRGERERRYEDDRRSSGGRRPPPAPRPGMLIRRQSSLDTFDRKPAPRYGPSRPRSPEVITMPGPGAGRTRRHSPPRYQEKEYDDIRIAEPDRYGDEHFRGWREREIERVRRRRDSSPHERPGREFVEEEEVIEEKPFPRKGRTRMSAHLLNKKALFDMGYPFEDEFTEQGHFIVILKALDKTLIDSVLFRSKEYNERERERITYAIEAPPPPPDRGETVIERREIIIDKDASEVPRSVREWDQMSGALGGGSHVGGGSHAGGPSHAGTKSHHGGGKSHAGVKSEHGGGAKSEHKSEHLSIHESRHDSSHHSRSRGRSPHGSSHSTIKEKERRRSRSSSSDEKRIVIERKPSRKSKSRHRSKARRGSTHRKVEYVQEEEIGVSNEMNTGPLALVLPNRSRSKSRRRSSIGERRIDEELKELDKEKKMLQKERKHSKKYHRDHSVSSSNSDEILIERKDSHGRKEDFEVKKDRKDSKLLKGMLATLT